MDERACRWSRQSRPGRALPNHMVDRPNAWFASGLVDRSLVATDCRLTCHGSRIAVDQDSARPKLRAIEYRRLMLRRVRRSGSRTDPLSRQSAQEWAVHVFGPAGADHRYRRHDGDVGNAPAGQDGQAAIAGPDGFQIGGGSADRKRGAEELLREIMG